MLEDTVEMWKQVNENTYVSNRGRVLKWCGKIGNWRKCTPKIQDRILDNLSDCVGANNVVTHPRG